MQTLISQLISTIRNREKLYSTQSERMIVNCIKQLISADCDQEKLNSFLEKLYIFFGDLDLQKVTYFCKLRSRETEYNFLEKLDSFS